MSEDPVRPSQVKLQLTTRQLDVALPETTGPILINTNLRRYALSTLVNHLLQTERPIPFEFLINGAFLRTSIDDYLASHGLSAETLLTVEYVRAIVPPTFVAAFEHDDWVSSVDVLSDSSPAASWAVDAVKGRQSNGDSSVSIGHERILSGSYDGFLRLWNSSSQCLAVSPGPRDGGHTAAVKAACFLSPSQAVSAGQDRSLRVWKTVDSSKDVALESVEPGNEAVATRILPTIELYGHKATVGAIDVHQPSRRILSASDDHVVGLWSTQKSDAPPAPSSPTPQGSDGPAVKRRKTTTSTSTPQRGALSMLRAHAGPVTDVAFAPEDATVGYSCSMDRTLRTWDLTTAQSVDTRTTLHPLLSIAALPDLHLVAAGSSARHITLIDPRASATNVSALTLRGHTNAVVTLARDPDSTYGLVSGSHDGTCRIWDVRSTRSDPQGRVSESIYTIARESAAANPRRVAGEGVKVFSVCWDRRIGIVSAGEDKRVQINRATLDPEIPRGAK